MAEVLAVSSILIDGGRDGGGGGLLLHLNKALLLDYHVVEGTGVALSHRLCIEVAGEMVARGWQCRPSSSAAAMTMRATTRVWEAATLAGQGAAAGLV